ncbi:hypothetical protein BKA70DRAFT_1536284, partial [Coprinopsis sp. MPI-PUGE-AT-0042]
LTQITQETILLNNLPAHPDVGCYLSDCFPGSRDKDEVRILRWVDSMKPMLVLYVLGKLGVGKSTLAKRLAERLRESNRLAAEVYFSFALPDWSAEWVIRMIAGQLCRAYPALMRSISEAIRLDVGPSVPVEARIRRLIIEPIHSLGLSQPLVVILDELDQWAPHPSLIKALMCLAEQSNTIRFVVLGRIDLEARFKNVLAKRYVSYNLPNVPERVMASYIQHCFGQLGWEDWANANTDVIRHLAVRADGFFIWTSTLCALLEDKSNSPDPYDTLSAFLKPEPEYTTNNTDVLASLYHTAINLRFPLPYHKALLKLYLGGVLVLQEPLPVANFAFLISMTVPSVQEMQARLSPLQVGSLKGARNMVYPASNTFHLSFLEYLQGTGTPTHLAFPIDAFGTHSHVAETCLKELNHFSTHEIPSLSPLQTYVARYWPIHTASGTPSVSPASDVEWRSTPHSALLERLTIVQWQHWAVVFVQLVDVDSGIDPTAKATDEALHAKLASLEGTQVPAGMSDVIGVAEVVVRLQHRNSDAWLKLADVYRDAALSTESRSFVERAVKARRFAADVAPLPNLFHQSCMLVASLASRRHQARERHELEKAIARDRELLLAIVPDHPDRATALINAATSLIRLIALTGTLKVIDESLTLSREALDLTPPGHPSRWASLAALALSLISHYECTGNMRSLDDSLGLSRECLKLCPLADEDRTFALNSLAGSLHLCFRLRGTAESLGESVTLLREVLQLRDNTDCTVSLSNLATCLVSHFKSTSAVYSLKESISLNRKALRHCQQDHPDRAHPLITLSRSLISRFEVKGTIENLHESIALSREAILFRSPDHPSRPFCLSTLALCLFHYYKWTGYVDSLNESISLNREALGLLPPGHMGRPVTLTHLAISLHSHFLLTRSSRSLDEAYTLGAEGLSRHVTGSPDHLLASYGVASVCLAQYEGLGRPYLDEAISLARESLKSAPIDHTDRHYALDLLAMALRHKPHRLTRSWSYSQKAVSLRPHNWEYHKNSATILLCCYRQSLSRLDLDKANSIYKRALSLCPPSNLGALTTLEDELFECQIYSSF